MHVTRRRAQVNVPVAGAWVRPVTDGEESARISGRHRLVHLVNGVLMVLAGIAVLVWPKPSLVVVTWLFGASLLANGVVRLVAAIAEPGASTARRVLLGLLGVLSVLAGMWCLRSPLPTLAAIALLIGTWWIASGVLTLLAAVTGSTDGSRVWDAALAVLSVAGGSFVLLQPRISLVALEVTVGLMLVVLGLVMVVDAVRARSAAAGKG
jgi:uncharacterized membrane protein HdeD (DUF308 family)